jgi:hypothetical protein
MPYKLNNLKTIKLKAITGGLNARRNLGLTDISARSSVHLFTTMLLNSLPELDSL